MIGILIKINCSYVNQMRADLVIASKWLESVKECKGCGIPDPLDCLPVRDYPNVIHGNNSVKEGNETFLVMRLSEPGCVIEQTKWRSGKIKYAA